jgi:hypothetical protein
MSQGKALMAYDKAWRASKMGKAIERNYHIKEYLIKQPDTKLNEIIHSVSKLNLKEFSTLTLIKEIIRVNPSWCSSWARSRHQSVDFFSCLLRSRRQSSSASFFVKTVKISPPGSSRCRWDDQFAAGSADGDKDEILYLQFPDLMADDGGAGSATISKIVPPGSRRAAGAAGSGSSNRDGTPRVRPGSR